VVAARSVAVAVGVTVVSIVVVCAVNTDDNAATQMTDNAATDNNAAMQMTDNNVDDNAATLVTTPQRRQQCHDADEGQRRNNDAAMQTKTPRRKQQLYNADDDSVMQTMGIDADNNNTDNDADNNAVVDTDDNTATQTMDVAQATRAKPEHTSCPGQAAPSCPDH
jgi:hypothetical protein